MNDLLTIKEFADIVKRSPQGIHKQAANENSRLFPYVVLENGKRMIKREALKEIYQLNQPNQPQNSTDSNDSTPKDNQINPEDSTDSNDSTEKFNSFNSEDSTDSTPHQEQEMIEFLMEQLKEKDKTINKLTTLLDQEQHLHAQTKLLLSAYQEKEDKEIQPEKEEQKEKQEPEKRKNWFMRWLFGEE